MIQNSLKAVFTVALIFITPAESYQEVVPIVFVVPPEPEVIVERISIENTPWTLDNEYHGLASNIYWEALNQQLEG